jgi:hypothetical protein
MKKPLTMPEEAQPRNITRADLVLTEGFGLEVDGRMKTVFPTLQAAEKKARSLKAEFPILQIKVMTLRRKPGLACFLIGHRRVESIGRSDYPATAGRHWRSGARQSTPISIDNCAEVSIGVPPGSRRRGTRRIANLQSDFSSYNK